MSVRVNLPPGCSGFDCKDGTRYTASRKGGTVEVEDRHARAINGGQYGQAGFISASASWSFGTREGRECRSCRRVWNVWSLICPRCEGDTVPWPPLREEPPPDVSRVRGSATDA